METFDQLTTSASSNLIPFPQAKIAPTKPSTPTYDVLLEEAEELDRLSKYRSEFDYSVYRDLELRYSDQPIRGGITKSSPAKLVNTHSTCQQCLYSFEIDSYGRGCIHNCVYCYAKAQLTVHGYWNNPVPVPIDINEVRRMFYTVFETDKASKWRGIMLRRTPLRIGAMSDSFMWVDQKYKVTQELLKILNYYRYPYLIITRSDLAAHDDYIALIDKKLASVQYSISSTNDALNRKIEPGAPSAYKRLRAIEKLAKEGIWTSVRINPIFPMRPDGFFSNPAFTWKGDVPTFDYSTFEMVDEIAQSGTKSIIAGFGRFSSFAINNVKKVTGVDLRPFFDRENVMKSNRDYHFSSREIQYYYEEYHRRTTSLGLDFSVCYIGNGDEQFWDSQTLWTNKQDCCNVKGKVFSFQSDSRSIPFSERMKFTTNKSLSPNDPSRLHAPLGLTVSEYADEKRT